MGFLDRIFGQRPKKNLKEWSCNFDSKDVEPFLQQVAPHIDAGFGKDQIQRVVDLVASTPHDETKGLEFPIKFRGRPSLMTISVFMDDVDSPDLYFFGPEALCELLNEEMDKFSNERGI